MAQSRYDEDGQPLLEPADLAESIGQYSGRGFQESVLDPGASDIILRYAQDAGMPSDWTRPAGHTRAGVRDSPHCAGGLRCSFWRVSTRLYWEILDEAVVMATDGHRLPDTISCTMTMPIPKAEIQAGAEEVPCSASTIRPITVMRVSAKLSALLFSSGLGHQDSGRPRAERR